MNGVVNLISNHDCKYKMIAPNQTDKAVGKGRECEPSKHPQFGKMLKCAVDEVSKFLIQIDVRS